MSRLLFSYFLSLSLLFIGEKSYGSEYNQVLSVYELTHKNQQNVSLLGHLHGGAFEFSIFRSIFLDNNTHSLTDKARFTKDMFKSEQIQKIIKLRRTVYETTVDLIKQNNINFIGVETTAMQTQSFIEKDAPTLIQTKTDLLSQGLNKKEIEDLFLYGLGVWHYLAFKTVENKEVSFEVIGLENMKARQEFQEAKTAYKKQKAQFSKICKNLNPNALCEKIISIIDAPHQGAETSQENYIRSLSILKKDFLDLSSALEHTEKTSLKVIEKQNQRDSHMVKNLSKFRKGARILMMVGLAHSLNLKTLISPSEASVSN